jgi:hypothetical protein
MQVLKILNVFLSRQERLGSSSPRVRLKRSRVVRSIRMMIRKDLLTGDNYAPPN